MTAASPRARPPTARAAVAAAARRCAACPYFGGRAGRTGGVNPYRARVRAGVAGLSTRSCAVAPPAF